MTNDKIKLEISRTINMLTAHPDNLDNSEFRDRIESLKDVLGFISDKPDFLHEKIRYDNSIKPMARIIYYEILVLSIELGYCNATNKHLAKLYSVSAKTVSRYISQLCEKGYCYSVFKYKDDSEEIEERRIFIKNQ